jgi:hypothetical protein
LWLFLGEENDNIESAILIITLIVSGYCLWVLALSRAARVELARRRDINKQRESDERRKFYEQLGEKSES